MIDRGPTRPIRFTGGHYDGPPFDYACRLVARLPGRIELRTTTSPQVTIQLRSRYHGKSIGGEETSLTSAICTYTTDAGDAGMARWEEDAEGNVVVWAGDY